MKYGIVVLEGPYQHQAAESAYNFVQAARAKGHEIYRIFFYTDGVNNANKYQKPPDVRNLGRLWSGLGGEGIDCIACVAGGVYRGMTEEVVIDNVRISGLGQLADLILQCDRVITFGD